MTRVRPPTRLALAVLGLLAAAPPAPAQVKYPPRPEKVDVQIRYRIRADRDERVRQFRALEAHLKKLGFVGTPMEDEDLAILDPTAERFAGTIPSANVFAILNDPRVRTILFAPAGYTYPDTPDKPVPIRVGIPTGFAPADQQRLHGQTVAQLQRLGFREAVGYDHRGYTIIRGDIPTGNLSRLLKDLRREPAGWFLADTPADQLPPPIRDLLPVRWVEVLPDADLNPAAPPAIPSNRMRMTPDLRAVMDDPASRDKPLRVEVVMEQPMDDLTAEQLRTRLRTAYFGVVEDPVTKTRKNEYATLEGIVRNVVTIRFRSPAEVDRFLFEPGVEGMRLPREATETLAPASGKGPAGPAAVLAAARIDRLRALGHTGQGVRVVVIASDFPGAAEMIGKELPASTRVIDLTAVLSPAILPAPAFPNRTSGGTVAARAAHIAAPDAELALVRVDPSALFQVLSVARLVRGDIKFSDALQSRIVELSFAATDFRTRYADAVEEYRKAFQNLSDEEGPRTRRENARKALEALQAEEKELTARIDRSTALQRALAALTGAQVIVNTLVWESGYPLDGLSELSQTIDNEFAGEAVVPAGVPRSATRPRLPVRPLWVQAASASDGSVWGGPYLDADGNGVMEFAAPTAPIPAGGWTRELNFLATRNPDGTVAANLPAGARVRLTVQWREPHDRFAYGGRDPIRALSLRVFRQLDPAGERRASDELEEVARTVGGPFIVRKDPEYGVYEQVVEFAVAAEGRFAVRVEGRPGFDPILPALRQQVEIAPRLFVEFVGDAAGKGRPVFASFAPRAAGVGIPGDAKAALAVAAGDGLTGAGMGVSLLVKPDLYAAEVPDAAGQGGPAAAAGLVGGAAAAMIGAGAPAGQLLPSTGMRPGGWLVIPESWLQYVPPRALRPPPR